MLVGILFIIFPTFISLYSCRSFIDDPFVYEQKFDYEIFFKCPHIDYEKIGVVYLGLPIYENIKEHLQISKRERNLSSFQLSNYYALLFLAKFFQSKPNNRILFFHINEYLNNVTNHYNRWFSDEFWSEKIPMKNVKFVHMNYKFENELTKTVNYYLVWEKILNEANNYFDVQKTHIIFVNGDTIIGPKVLSCFSLDLKTAKLNDPHKQKFNVGFDCYRAMFKKSQTWSYYSFLYKIRNIHLPNEFSGFLIWKIDKNINVSLKLDSELIKNNDIIEISNHNNDIQDDFTNLKETQKSSIVNIVSDVFINQMNLYKYSHKDDLIKATKFNFQDDYGIFGYEFNKIDPPILENFFTLDNYFASIIRNIFYNISKPISYETKKFPTIPNIVHMIWFGEKYSVLKFIDYLSLKSVLTVLKPDKVKIHGDIEPDGDLWDSIKNHPKIEWVFKERPIHRYGHDFTSAPIQHIADLARLEVVYEEGGLYTDFDILWVKSIDHFRYLDVELIASNDLTSYCFEFPNNIQIGAFLAPAKSEFIKNWLSKYVYYHLYPGDYTAISMCEPYKLYEKKPSKVFIENRLQMIYFNGWSIFIPRFVHHNHVHEYNVNMDWLNNGSYGYHLPRHGALFTQESFKKADKTSTPIKIANYINDLPLDSGEK